MVALDQWFYRPAQFHSANPALSSLRTKKGELNCQTTKKEPEQLTEQISEAARSWKVSVKGLVFEIFGSGRTAPAGSINTAIISDRGFRRSLIIDGIQAD